MRSALEENISEGHVWGSAIRKKKSAPLSMTFMIMAFLIIFIVLAKWSITKGMEINTQSDFSQEVFQPRDGLNEAELQVLQGLLTLVSDGSIDQSSNQIITEQIYFSCLREHYEDIRMNLTSAAADRIDQLIRDGNQLLLLENGKTISEMSLDGREVAIHILKKIYGLSGLWLEIHPDGTIEQITSTEGRIYYEDNAELREEFRIHSLIIILMVLLLLFSLCIILTKRKQLFDKGEEYMNEKGIA